MAKINRSDVIQKAVNDLAISIANDKVPTETLDKVQLTYDLNPKYSSFVAEGAKITSGSLTISLPVIDARSEIYITNLSVDFIKDAACDIATGTLQLAGITALHGTIKTLVEFSIISLTAQTSRCDMTFSHPLKLKPNTSLTFYGTYAAGVMSRSVLVTGFITSSN
jgi:hypothetical protein